MLYDTGEKARREESIWQKTLIDCQALVSSIAAVNSLQKRRPAQDPNYLPRFKRVTN
jgi:hypothetical protein